MRTPSELLKRDYAPSAGPVVKIATIPKLPCPVTLGADDRTVMLEVVRFYADTLRDTPDAKRYLEKRGLKSSELVERFRLGFSDRMLGPALPDKNRRAGAEIRRAVGAAGRLPRERPRASARFAGDPGVQSGRRRGADVWAEDQRQSARRDGLPPVPAGADARRVERRSARRQQRNHPLRSADRRADVLVLRAIAR